MEDWGCKWTSHPKFFIKVGWGGNRLPLEKSLSGRLENWASLWGWDDTKAPSLHGRCSPGLSSLQIPHLVSLSLRDMERMIIKSSMAPCGDRARKLGAYTGAGGTGRDSEQRDRAWSLAGPIQRAASIWTSARLPEKRGVESTQFHQGLGIRVLV